MRAAMIAADLKQWRQRLGHSLTTAAQALGVNRSTYCRMESGATRIDRRTELACLWLEDHGSARCSA